MRNIAAILTRSNAYRWEREQDQYIFVIDLLEISANHRCADELVELVEDTFDLMIAGVDTDGHYEVMI